MPSKGQQAVDALEAHLGRAESPRGSNCGGSEMFQAVYPYLGKCGWPWCGAAVGWSYREVQAGGEDFADPSTATMCSSKPNAPIQPGSAWTLCGTHTCLVRYSLGGGVYACVGGNEDDQVSFSSRSFGSNVQSVGPPWLGEGGEPSEPPEKDWYGLQDVKAARDAGQREYYGGWSSKASRDDRYTALKKDLGHELRKFQDPDFDGAFLIDNTAFMPSPEVYGLWSSKASRDDARKTLEDRLNRTLRPFSVSRTKAQGGVPWNCPLEDPFA